MALVGFKKNKKLLGDYNLKKKWSDPKSFSILKNSLSLTQSDELNLFKSSAPNSVTHTKTIVF